MTTDTITGASRQRLVTWVDPLATRDAMLAMDGPTFRAEATTGSLPAPPMLRLMGIRIRAGAAGQIVFEAEPAEYHYSTMGAIHGDFAATMLESAIGYTLQLHLPARVGITTLDLKLAYLRTMTAQAGAVHTDTTIVSLDWRVANVESRLLDTRERIYAIASATCLIPGPEEGSH